MAKRKQKRTNAVAKSARLNIKKMPRIKQTKALSKYQGVVVGGKRYTRYSQIKTAKRKTTKDTIGGGVMMAIL